LHDQIVLCAGIKLTEPANAGRIFPGKNTEIAHGSADTANQVKNNKPFGTQDILNNIAKHPQGKHIEKQMRYVPVHEHVGYQLPWFEKRGFPMEQSQVIIQVYYLQVFQHNGCQENNDINNEEVLYNWRQYLESAGTVCTHEGFLA